MSRKIIRNIIKTPDGTILESAHTHDYIQYRDKNGELYVNDGGKDYLRRSVNKEPFEDLTIYADDDFEIVRVNFLWGTYGKFGTEGLHYKKLSEMSNDHIKAIINDNMHSETILDILKSELTYREQNSIFIED